MLDQRISERAGSLTPKLREAAEFVRAHPAEVATRSLRQVARAAGVTPATLSRLARALGYSRYEGLRETCRESVGASRESLAERALRQGRLGHSGETDLRASVDTTIRGLEALCANTSAERLDAAVAALLEARRVLLLGAMSGASMVEYFGHMGRMAFGNWQVASGSAAADKLCGLGPGDALLVVTLTPYTRSTVEQARLAHESGVTLVVITDRIDSPVLPMADHAFLVATEGNLFFPSHGIVMVLLETIMGMLVRQAGRRAQRRIDAVEKTHRALGDYYVQ